MAEYKDKTKLFKQALKIIDEYQVPFIQDVIEKMPLSKGTFYKYFPVKSKEYADIVEKLDSVRVNKKAVIFKKWECGENFTGQLLAYKLMATKDELAILNNSSRTEDKENNIVEIIKAVADLNRGNTDVR